MGPWSGCCGPPSWPDTIRGPCSGLRSRSAISRGRMLAAVLHGRVRRSSAPSCKSTEAMWSGLRRLHPVANQFARELAAAMDERVSLLGNQVAVDRPAWALRYLGELRPTLLNEPSGYGERQRWRLTGRNADTPTRPKPSDLRLSGHRLSCGPAGMRPAWLCECRMSMGPPKSGGCWVLTAPSIRPTSGDSCSSGIRKATQAACQLARSSGDARSGAGPMASVSWAYPRSSR